MKHVIPTLVVALLVATTFASAQVVVETNAGKVDPTVHTLLGFSVGSEYGYGIALRYGSQKIALELGGGFTPLYSFYTEQYYDPGKDDELHFKVFNNVIAAAKLDFMIKNNPDRRLGLKIGVEYSTIRTYGAGMALSLQVHKEPSIFITAGISYYPEGAAKIRSELERRTNGIVEHSDFDDVINNTSIVLSVNFFLWP